MKDGEKDEDEKPSEQTATQSRVIDSKEQVIDGEVIKEKDKA
jgi:hypothetical protein